MEEPPPQRRRPWQTTAAGWFLVAQGVALLVCASASFWQLRRVDQIIHEAFAGLAATQRVGVTAVQAREALSALLKDRMIYALALGPPLIAIGWWLLSRPSGRAQRAAMIAGVAAPLLCLTTAWYVSATGNDVTDELMGHAPTTTVGQNIAEVLGSGWLTTPFTCLMAAGLVYVKRHPT